MITDNELRLIMLDALGDALIAMGRAGANHDITHPQRAAWEKCRKAIQAACVAPPLTPPPGSLK